MSRYLPWLMYGLAGLFYAYDLVLRLLPSTMIPELSAYFSLSKSELGILSSMFYLGYVSATAVSGTLYDYFGVRRVLISASIACALGTLLFSMTESFYAAQAARCVMGMGSAFAFIGVLKIGFDWLPHRWIGKLLGLVSFMAMVVAMLGQSLLTPVAAVVPWQELTRALALLGMVIFLLFVLLIRDKKQTTSQIKSQRSSFAALLAETRSIVLTRRFWLLGVIGMISYIPIAGFAELWCAPYLEAVYHVTRDNAAFDSSMVFLGWGFGAPCFGMLRDKMHDWLRPLLFGVSAATLCVAWLLYGSVSESLLPTMLFAFGFFSSSHVLVFIGAKESAPSHMTATALALNNFVVMMSGFLIQPGIGLLLDFLHSFQIALAVIPCSMAFCALLVLLLLSASTNPATKTAEH